MFVPFLLFCRGVYAPAEEYTNHADKLPITLVEAFRNLQVDEEEPFENGDANHDEVYENSNFHINQ